MANQVFEGTCYLGVGATFQGILEVFAVDLTVPEKGAEAGVEDARGEGEGERPDLRLVPELPDPDRVVWTLCAARVVEEGYLRQHY